MNNKENFLQKFSTEYGIGKKRIQYYKRFWGASRFILNNKLKYKISIRIKNRLKFILHGDALRQFIKNKIIIMQKSKSFKGICHLLKLPTRGQRTHTNGKTRKKYKALF